jgi:hypothetical protein
MRAEAASAFRGHCSSTSDNLSRKDSGFAVHYPRHYKIQNKFAAPGEACCFLQKK